MTLEMRMIYAVVEITSVERAEPPEKSTRGQKTKTSEDENKKAIINANADYCNLPYEQRLQLELQSLFGSESNV